MEKWEPGSVVVLLALRDHAAVAACPAEDGDDGHAVVQRLAQGFEGPKLGPARTSPVPIVIGDQRPVARHELPERHFLPVKASTDSLVEGNRPPAPGKHTGVGDELA